MFAVTIQDVVQIPNLHPYVCFTTLGETPKVPATLHKMSLLSLLTKMVEFYLVRFENVTFCH